MTKASPLVQLAGEVPGTPQYDPHLAGLMGHRSGSHPESEEAEFGEKAGQV